MLLLFLSSITASIWVSKFICFQLIFRLLIRSWNQAYLALVYIHISSINIAEFGNQKKIADQMIAREHDNNQIKSLFFHTHMLPCMMSAWAEPLYCNFGPSPMSKEKKKGVCTRRKGPSRNDGFSFWHIFLAHKRRLHPAPVSELATKDN